MGSRSPIASVLFALTLFVVGLNAGVGEAGDRACDAPACSGAALCPDGNLRPELEAIVGPGSDLNGNGIPDLLERGNRVGWWWWYVDPAPLDGSGGANSPGPDGFNDAPIGTEGLPGPGYPCVYNNPQGQLGVKSPLNHGKVLLMYVPRTPGLPEGQDDSVLYIGLDICNGDPYTVTGTVNGGPVAFKVDYELPAFLTPCQYGLPALLVPPALCSRYPALKNVMVPFDADGDGDPETVTRYNLSFTAEPPGDSPETGASDRAIIENLQKYYQISLFRPVGGGQRQYVLLRSLQMFLAQGRRIRHLDFLAGGIEVSPDNGAAFPYWPSLSDNDHVQCIRDLRAGFCAAGPNGTHNLDVEFVVKRIDELVSSHFSVPIGEAADYLACLTFEIQSGGSAQDGGEDFSQVEIAQGNPKLEVRKYIQCADAPLDAATAPGAGTVMRVDRGGLTSDRVGDGAGRGEVGLAGPLGQWKTRVNALPGSTVIFGIEVENSGTTELAVTLKDVLEGLPQLENIGNLTASLIRPSDPAQDGPITAGNALTKCPPLNRVFFLPLGGLLDPGTPENPYPNLRGGEVCLGVLKGKDVCNGVFSGDKVFITFTARIKADPGVDPCGNGEEIVNRITGIGDPDVQLNPNQPIPPGECYIAGPCADPDGEIGNEVYDRHDVIDTEEEFGFNPPQDNNVVSANLVCRGLTFDKKVALCADCGACGAFVDQLTVPYGPFPLCIRYRYVVTNNGDISETVRIYDDFLCADVATIPGASLVDCEVCPNGSNPIEIPPGGTSAPVYCTVRFENAAALDAFLRKDDVPPGTPRICGTLPLPGQTNARCYSNCGRARATLTTPTPGPDPLCGTAEPLNFYDTAQVCGCCATIDVTKDAACLTGDTPGPYSDPLDNLVPGSRARFRVTICNTTAEGTPVSKLRITDTLAGTPAACVTLVPGSAVFRRGAQVCATPGGFNIVGTPFEWDLATCGGDLPAGQCVEFTFDVRIADNATENCDPLNTVRVEAQPNCGQGVPPFWCGEDTDTASINVRRVGLTCTKQWRAEWDSNADCQPGPGLKPGASVNDYTNDLDLRDVVFPVRLYLRVTATNTGEVPLDVTPSDTILCSDCVRNTLGITIESSEICSILPDPPNEPVVKTVPAGGTQTWTVVVRVDNAAAARAIAQNCDLAIDNQPLIFKNRVTMTGAPSGVCPGNSVNGGPCEAQIRVPEPCTLTIDKKVKCADDPDTAYAASVEALPGARLRYRIQVCNASTLTKIPRICLTDTLCQGDPANCACRTWFDANSVTANIAGADVTNCVKPTFKVDGTEVCFTFPACRPAAPWLAPGECLTITFDVVVPPGFSAGGSNCQPGPNPDCRNVASAKGFTEACPPTNATPCTAGPVQADINVKVPRIECEKAVCVDYGNDGTCSPPPDSGFLNQVNVDCNANFPFTLLYRYTVRNAGETGLTNVTVCDSQLIADICQANAGLPPADQIVVVACDLCDGACCPPAGSDGCRALPDLPNCGDTATATCRVRIPSRAAWLALAALDTDNDPNCYTNSGQATAQVRVIGTTLCDFEANVNVNSAPCSAVVCVSPPCNLTVDKEVQCTDGCNGDGVGGPLDVVPGSGFEYQIVVTNNDGASYSSTICALRLTDTLVGPTTWVAATWIPCEYKATPASAVVNIPQCFKVDGTPYVVNLPTPMQTGGTLTARFKPCVAANPAPGENTIDNTIVVEGAPNCPTAGPIFCCTSNDTVRLNIKRPAVACVKEWCAQWDSNANGAIDAGDATLPCTSNLDLCLAVFPVRLTLRVTANNTGNVDLLVTPNDQNAIACMEARGASVGACELRPLVAKSVPAGGSATWTCVINVPNAQVMRDIAEFCDVLIDNRPRVFVNRVTLTGVPTGVCPGNAIESAPCEAEIRVPEPCDLTIDKRVKCLPEDDAAYRYLAQALPGARVKYRVQICNLAGVCQPRVPQIDLRDVFCNAGAVDATTVRADVNGVDVTACLPAPLNFTGGANYIKFGPCLPGRPWLEPGECLTVTFEATMPAGIPPVNCVSNPTPECRNRARAVGYTEALTPPPTTLPRCNANPVMGAFTCVTQQQDPQNWPYWVCADVDVRVPQVACTKLVSADLDGVAGYEVGPAQQIDFDINSATFPIRIQFIIRATNTGEVPLGPVTINDVGLVAAAIAAGVAPADIVCSSGGPPWAIAQLSNCGDTSTDVGCVITFQTEQIFAAFLAQDGEQDPECFTNVAEVLGTPIPGALCGSAGDVSSQCAAQVCSAGGPCCPPIVKAVVDIWNQNEIRMSGTERCLCAWDETLLSRWTLESGLPNHFLRQFLQTDRGRARIDGVRSVVVCGPESQAWPLLGVSMKFLKFGSDVTQAGVPLTAVGEERGLILVPGASPPRGKGAGDALTQLERMKLYDSGVPDETPGGRSVENDVPFTRRADTTEKGSFLAFVKIEIKWDSSGRLIQDTFIQLTNDGSSDVFVKVFQVNDNHRDCPAIDNTIVLTHDEPAYWAASTGQPKGVSAFTLLDPQGDPDTDPHNPGGRVLRGYIIAFAVNSVDAEIRWNHLSGAATIVNYALRSAWEYNPWSFRAWSAEEGQVLAGNPGQLEFDGVEYDWAPARLLLEFFAPGVRLQSSSGKSVVVEDTDLTLWAMFRDLTEF